jgi:hypothetical protein
VRFRAPLQPGCTPKVQRNLAGGERFWTTNRRVRDTAFRTSRAPGVKAVAVAQVAVNLWPGHILPVNRYEGAVHQNRQWFSRAVRHPRPASISRLTNMLAGHWLGASCRFRPSTWLGHQWFAPAGGANLLFQQAAHVPPSSRQSGWWCRASAAGRGRCECGAEAAQAVPRIRMMLARPAY